MINIWDQTIHISADLVRKLIKNQARIEVKKLEFMGEGFDNLAYLVNKEFVFRFPRREWGVTCMESEITLLPYIAEHVTFPLTAPQFIGKPTKDYPYPFAGYPLIKGKALCDATKPLINDREFARILGEWLKQLHSTPVRPKHKRMVGDEQHVWRLDIPNRMEVLIKSVHQYESYYAKCGFDKSMLLDIIGSFSFLNFSDYKSCYLHGDLYSRHIMVDENLMPTGLIDWGDVHVGHPGLDLSIGFIFTDNALEEFMNSYGGMDNETMKVAIFRALCHSAMCLPYACQQNDPGFKTWTIAVFEREITKFKAWIRNGK